MAFREILNWFFMLGFGFGLGFAILLLPVLVTGFDLSKARQEIGLCPYQCEGQVQSLKINNHIVYMCTKPKENN